MKQSLRYKEFFKLSQGAFDQRIAITPEDAAESVISTALAPALKAENVTDVLPLGCFDSQCVLETAKGASKDFQVSYDRDLNIMLDEDAESWTERTLKMYKQAFDFQWADALAKHPDMKAVPKAPDAPCSD